MHFVTGLLRRGLAVIAAALLLTANANAAGGTLALRGRERAGAA